MIEEDNLVRQKLKIEFKSNKTDKQNFINAIPDINKETHPLLHSYIST